MQAGPSQKRDAPPTNRPKKKSIRFNGLGNRRNPGKQWTGARRGDQSGLGQVKIKDIKVKKWQMEKKQLDNKYVHVSTASGGDSQETQ